MAIVLVFFSPAPSTAQGHLLDDEHEGRDGDLEEVPGTAQQLLEHLFSTGF